MNIQKINIKIENNRRFGLVAFLIDRDDYLKDISDIQQTLKLKHFPYVLPEYPYEEARNVAKAYRNNLITISEVRDILYEICRANNMYLAEIDMTLATAYMYAESIMKRYNRSRLYLPIILASILTGNVQEYDFRSTYRLDLNYESMKLLREQLEPDEELVTIVVNRESNYKEIKDTFDNLRKYRFGTKKTEKNDRVEELLTEDLPQDKLPDTISNIKDHREWYWMNKSGLGYQKIWQEVNKTKPGISKDAITKAIQQYKRILRMKL